jgi:hypothetical protein
MTKETWVQIFVGVEQDGPSSGFWVHQLRTDLVLGGFKHGFSDSGSKSAKRISNYFKVLHIDHIVDGCEILHQLVDGKHPLIIPLFTVFHSYQYLLFVPSDQPV